MIYDTFLFFNELELLELRLNELDAVVDRFVIVEATRTFTNQPKPLYYQDHRDQFRSFHSKIIHVIVEDPPLATNPWILEESQRNAIARGLGSCQPDDIIMVSDLDEIPRATKVNEAAEAVRFSAGPVASTWHRLLKQRVVTRSFRNLFKKWHPFVISFEHRMFAFFLNAPAVDNPIWTGTRMTRFRDFTRAEELRQWKGRKVSDGGWHFTFMGGVERIQAKLAAYSHQEHNIPAKNDSEQISQALREGRNLLDPKSRIKLEDIDDSYPVYLRSHLKKYRHWIRPVR